MFAILIIFAIAALLYAVIASRPSDFRVTRTIDISAPASTVFPQVNDFHKWEAWSPWAKLDPAAQNTFEGAPAGVGAVFKWSGNSKVGQGCMTITESRPGEFIKIKLEFLRPFKATNTTEFTFQPQNNQTHVT